MGRPRKRREEPAVTIEADDPSSSSMPAPVRSEFMVNGFNTFDANLETNGTPYAITADHDFYQSQNFPVDPYLQDFSTADMPTAPHGIVGNLGVDQQFPFLSQLSSTTTMCGCLSELYISLSSLQALSSFGFPMTLPPIRLACNTAYGVLTCQQCPKDRNTAMSNLMLLTTLLTSIVERYDRILKQIDADAQQASNAGETVPFRMGENRPEYAHLHTGTLDCPMGFDIDLSPSEWRKLARKAIRADVLGPAPHGRQSISDIVDLFEQRQHQWHLRPEVESLRVQCAKLNGNNVAAADGMCLRFIQVIRNHIQCLELGNEVTMA
jgi:hypothetical protein